MRYYKRGKIPQHAWEIRESPAVFPRELCGMILPPRLRCNAISNFPPTLDAAPVVDYDGGRREDERAVDFFVNGFNICSFSTR